MPDGPLLPSPLAAAILTLALTVGASGTARAELAAFGACAPDAKVCPKYVPRLDPKSDWRRDESLGAEAGADFLVPRDARGGEGRLFIYALAVEAPREAPTVTAFIDADQVKMKRAHPGVVQRARAAMVTEDQRFLPTYEIDDPRTGRFEIVAYAEDTGPDRKRYYLSFVLSTASAAERMQARPVFVSLLARYRR